MSTSHTGHSGVAVVVPTYNAARLLVELLESLRDQTLRHQVVVVDNGSHDGTDALVVERFPEVTLVRTNENLGFGRAINRGVEATDADVLVFVNNDVVCAPTFLRELCGALAPADGVVMAAGILVQAAKPHRIDTAGIEYGPTLLAFDYLHGEPISVLEDSVRDPLGPCAGAAAFDRAAFESVCGFDENFFAYLEDVDLVVRLRAKGGGCRLARRARGVHRHSATLGARSRRKHELIGWSRGYMIGKYRLHRRPRLLARTLLEEATGALGKVVVDGATPGVVPRAAGWQAGLRVAAEPLPSLPGEVTGISFLEAQRRRLRRRLAGP